MLIAERSGTFDSHATCCLIVLQINLPPPVVSVKDDGKKEVTVFLGIEVCKPFFALLNVTRKEFSWALVTLYGRRSTCGW